MLQLPATSEQFLVGAVEPALQLLPAAMNSLEARLLLVVVALQESALKHRFQVVAGQPGVKGPARGLAQFERGGCTGVLRHSASRYWMHAVCRARNCDPTPKALWLAIERDDILATAAARLLLFTDPKRLPSVSDAQGAWELYLRTWRPGAVKRDAVKLRAKWGVNHARAVEAVVKLGCR